MFVGRIHKVNFKLDPNKHTVYLAEQAQRATSEPLKGLASPGRHKAIIGKTEQEIIEALRMTLKQDIQNWNESYDPKDFSFNAAITEVEDNSFWSYFTMVDGTNYKIHEPNN